jgi:O-antigen/teichoic acid export membrane protein
VSRAIALQPQSVTALSTDHLHVDLRGRSLRGGVVNLTSQGAQFLIQSVATIVLARLLTPADFGLVAMVATITGLGQAFADLGLSEATIQRREITHNQVSTLFWINFAIGVGLMLVTMGLAPVLAWFYRDARLVTITLVLSLTFLVGGLRVQADAVLKRQMRFTALAFRDIASSVIAVPIAITIAWQGGRYWALVALPLMTNFLQMALSWVISNWRPGLPRRDSEIGSMIAFGGNVAASYFVINVSRSADNVLIGWRWGAGPLGLYSRAYNLLMIPVRQLTVPAGSVAVPAFSRTQDDPERFARYYLKAVNLILWISAPVFGFLFVAAHPVIVLMLGHQWGEAAPVFQILTISALGQLLLDSTTWLLVSRGQSRRLLKLLLIFSPILVCSYAIGLPFGIKGVALSGSLVMLLILPWMLQFSFRETSLTLPRLGRAIFYPVALSLFGVLTAGMVLRLAGPADTISELFVGALGFLAAYALSALIPAVRREAMSLRNLVDEFRTPVSPSTVGACE